jgi:hypothetical protein
MASSRTCLISLPAAVGGVPIIAPEQPMAARGCHFEKLSNVIASARSGQL